MHHAIIHGITSAPAKLDLVPLEVGPVLYYLNERLKDIAVSIVARLEGRKSESLPCFLA